MMTKDSEPITVDEAAQPGPESTDPVYLAWKEQKIRLSLKHAEDDPDDYRTHDQVFDQIKEKFRP